MTSWKSDPQELLNSNATYVAFFDENGTDVTKNIASLSEEPLNYG